MLDSPSLSSAPSRAGVQRSSPRVLVVSDDVRQREQLTLALYAAGYDNLLSADDALLAITMIRNNPPQLVLARAEMEGGTGVDLAQWMQLERASADIPVILLTEARESASVLASAGIESLYSAPLDFAKFRTVLSRHAPHRAVQLCA